MAFRFFRKRQKMVIIVMVALMVSFLIGIQGFNLLFRKRPGERTVGTVGDDEIKSKHLQQARRDIDLLQQFLGLGDPRRLLRMGLRPTESEFLWLVHNDARASPAFALLLHEARQAGLSVSDDEVQEFFGWMLTEAQKESLRRRLQSSNMAFSDLEGAAGRWLLVYKAYLEAAVSAPPSEAELRDLYRQLREEINLRVARVGSEKFLASLPPSGDEEVRAQFRAYRDNPPGRTSDDNPHGFGYKQPDRARVSYLLIRDDAIRRVIRPSDKQILDHFRAHRDRYVREVWPQPGKTAEQFVTDLMAGLSDEALRRAQPGSAAAKALKKLTPPTAAEEVTLEKVLADSADALAVTTEVKDESGRTGPIVLRLAKPAGSDAWQVVRFAVQTKADAAKAEVDFKDERPDAEAVKKTSVRMLLHEAEDQIVAEFASEVVEDRMKAVARLVRDLLKQADTGAEAVGGDRFAWVRQQMIAPGQQVLSRELAGRDVRPIRAVRLDEAVKRLARAAALGAICYPWGEHGQTSIPRDIRVTVEVEGQAPITLGEALAQIDAQVFGKVLAEEATTQPSTRPATQPSTHPASRPVTRPASRPATRPASRPTTRPVDVRLRWATCKGLRVSGRDVLFCLGGYEGLDFFPIQVGQTERLTREELSRHRLLGACWTSPKARTGERLVDAAFSARPFHPEGKTAPRVEVGKDGATMYASGLEAGTSGVVLWRLTEAKPAFAPSQPGEVPGLRQRVVRDVELLRGYEKAGAAARELAASAAKGDLASQAKARGIETVETGLFARKYYNPAREMGLWIYGYTRRPEALERALFEQPHQFPYSRPPNVTLPGEKGPEASAKEAAIREAFIKKAFSLVPRYEAATAPSTPAPTAVVPVPAGNAVFVLQRIGYRPPIASEYENPPPRQPGRATLWAALRENQRWQMRQTWFGYEHIARRLGYKPAEP